MSSSTMDLEMNHADREFEEETGVLIFYILIQGPLTKFLT